MFRLVSGFGAFFVLFRTAIRNRSSKRHAKATCQTEDGVPSRDDFVERLPRRGEQFGRYALSGKCDVVSRSRSDDH
jgi:hypothetical protein